MTRAEHLAWAKARALELVDAGELEQAVASMISDLGKHEGTVMHGAPASVVIALGIAEVDRGAAAVRHWIEGFN